MKEIEKKDTPEISGGYQPGDGGCIPVAPPIQLPDARPATTRSARSARGPDPTSSSPTRRPSDLHHYPGDMT